jgi:acyl carrier protein
MTFNDFCRFISGYTHTPVEDIKENTSFRDELGIDSLQMVNLIVVLAEKMEAELNAIRGSDDFATVGRLYQAMTKDVTL